MVLKVWWEPVIFALRFETSVFFNVVIKHLKVSINYNFLIHSTVILYQSVVYGDGIMLTHQFVTQLNYLYDCFSSMHSHIKLQEQNLNPSHREHWIFYSCRHQMLSKVPIHNVNIIVFLLPYVVIVNYDWVEGRSLITSLFPNPKREKTMWKTTRTCIITAKLVLPLNFAEFSWKL